MADEAQTATPEIDYLSKDFASFRQLMLNHLTSRVPEWKEVSEADIGNVIVELLAYVGDYLSYYQDAVATEAYLGTARRRPSIKHHVRLLDYVLHEGCNARVWVNLEVSRDTVLPPKTPLLTRVGELSGIPVIQPGSPAYNDASEQQLTIFETRDSSPLFVAHNTIEFFVAEDQDASLPPGSTRALLLAPATALRIGQVLLFEEVKGVASDEALDADPTHRHAVRLTRIAQGLRAATPVVSVEWDIEDALPFTLVIAQHYDGEYFSGLSVARGNMLLADHGHTVHYEPLPPVTTNRRYHPRLLLAELTHCEPDEDESTSSVLSASQALLQDPSEAMPALTLFKRDDLASISLDADSVLALRNNSLPPTLRATLYSSLGIVFSDAVTVSSIQGQGWMLNDPARKQSLLLNGDTHALEVSILKQWTLRCDLVSSMPLVDTYCVDMEDDGHAYLRFCTLASGEPPPADASFVATYRVGRGVKGHIQADTLAHVISNDESITRVRNPLASRGGINPLPIEEARQQAPFDFQSQQRCITETDYEEIVCRHPQVVNTFAQLRWLGSGHKTFVYVQRSPGLATDEAFKTEIARYLEDFRTAGSEIEVRAPRYVGLHIALRIALSVGYYTNIVHNDLMDTFSNNPSGFFYAGNFTFGQNVYLSQIIATAMEIRGVSEVEVEQFHRLDAPPTTAAHVEQIVIHPFEIIRLDNDERAPQNGSIVFHIERGL